MGLTKEERAAQKAEQERADAAIREAVESDLYTWCKFVMGFRGMDEVPHLRMCQFIENWDDWKWVGRDDRVSGAKQHKKILLVPRNTYKTTIATIGYALQQYVKHPDIRVLIEQSNLDKSTHKLRLVKNQIVGAGFDKRGGFKHLYGNRRHSDPQIDLWREDQIRLTPLTDEATITAASPGHEKTSFHYDLIIADDLHDENNSNTKEQVDKIIRHIRLLLAVLAPNGRLLLIGTRWSDFDAYAWALESLRHTTIMVDKAERDDGTIFWPRVFTPEYLGDLKSEMGPYIFSAQMQNEPVAPEDQEFKQEWIRYYDDLPVGPMYTFLTIDPVPPPSQARKKGDYAAFVVTGVVPGGKVYVIEAIRARPNLLESAELLLTLVDRWNIRGVGIETAAGQRTYKLAIERICKVEKDRAVPWVMLETSSRTSKEQRIRGLVPWVARGDVLIRRQMTELEGELLRFPRATHDDLLDALAYGPQLWHAPRAAQSMSEPLAMFDPRVKVPYLSVAWFMRQDRARELTKDRERLSNKRTTWKSVFHR